MKTKRLTRKRKSPAKSRKPSRKRKSKREQENRLDAFAALALMRREGLLASSAAEAEGTTVKNILKHVRRALRKRGKDFVARRSDRLIRTVTAIDAKGTRPIVVRSSNAASLVGKYWNAVDEALKGKPSALRKFRGKKIPYNKLKFLTALKTLERLQDAGLLANLKDIYWHGKRR